MEFEAGVVRLDSEVWYLAVPVPKEISSHFQKLGTRRVVCTFNNKVKNHCALMPGGDLGWYILINKEIRKKLDVREGELVKIHLKKDDSEYGMPMPEEFSTALDLDEEGKHYFHELTPGKQRSLIHLVGKLKNPDKRISKALTILEHLKEVHGKLDYKMLNEAFKRANQRNI